MSKHIILLILCAVLTSTCSAINIPLTSNYIEVEAGGFSDYDIKTANFPGTAETMASRSFGNSFVRSHISYEAINNARSASFDLTIDMQGENLSSNARAAASLSLYLSEPVMYTISGSLDCLTDMPGVDFRGYWTLFNGGEAIYYYSEDKWARDSAFLEADNIVDSPFFPADLTGIIPAGVYAFIFSAQFDSRASLGATVHVTGLTNLTLSRLVPEPSSHAIILVIFGSILFFRQVSLLH
jgi:hypothetical protein